MGILNWRFGKCGKTFAEEDIREAISLSEGDKHWEFDPRWYDDELLFGPKECYKGGYKAHTVSETYTLSS